MKVMMMLVTYDTSYGSFWTMLTLTRLIRLVGLRDASLLPLGCLVSVVVSNFGRLSTGVAGLSGVDTLYTGRAR